MEFDGPAEPMVFAITYRQDPLSRPKSHTVLYFGCTDDTPAAMLKVQNDLEGLWLQSGGKMDELYVFMHPMPGTTRTERQHLQQKLLLEYSPQGNY